jgi:DNA-binding Xre family transcriptional regulator
MIPLPCFAHSVIIKTLRAKQREVATMLTLSKEQVADRKRRERENPSVRVRFVEMVARKSERERRRITTHTVVVETQLPQNALNDMANGSIREVPLWLLGPLCDYLECSPADLFERKAH